MKIPIISDWLEKRYKSTLSQPEQWFVDMFMGGEANSGVHVDENNALCVGAVFACVSRLSETIGSLPIILYKRDGKGKTRATNKKLYSILHDLPNESMTAMTFKETLMTHCLLYGHAFAEIVRNGAGEVQALYPIMPYRVQIKIKNNKTYYFINLPDGKQKILSQRQVFYMPWLTVNGIEAYRPVMLAREIIGLSMATESFSAKYFKNGTNTGGVVEHPAKLSDPAFNRLKKSMQESYEGLGNAHRMLLLEEGMKFQKIIIPPNDSQMLESRKHQVEEIARFYNVPPHIIQDLSRATFSNIEEQGVYYAVHSIRPWAIRWEQAIYRCLLSEIDRREYFAELMIDALMRGNIESRYKAYAVGRQWGWLSINDIRNKENMDPITQDGGDIYLMPLNMTDINNPPDVEEEPKKKEGRSHIEHRSSRMNISESFEGIFEDMTARIVRKEKQNIMAEARKQLSTRNIDTFIAWLERYYDGLDDYLRKQFTPPTRSLAEAIYREAMKEVDYSQDLTDQYEEFVAKYINGQVERYRGSRLAQLK